MLVPNLLPKAVPHNGSRLLLSFIVRPEDRETGDDAQALRHHLQIAAQEGPQLLHPGPSSYPDSPACVEGEFLEVHFHGSVLILIHRSGYPTQSWASSTRS
jgi:hypothetical protein